jgi:hypothetical protein
MHEQNQPPFSSELNTHPEILSDVNRFLTLKDRPEYVVKELTFDSFKSNQELLLPGQTEQEYLLSHAGHGQTLLREFSELTQIKIPSSELILGANESNQQVLYRVSEEVMGLDLAEALAGDEVDDTQLSELVSSIFEYYRTKYYSKEDYSCDVAFLKQYRFGRTLSRPSDAIFMADTDPYYGRGATTIEQDGADDDDYMIESMFDLTLKLLEDIETARGRSINPGLKNTIWDFINSVDEMKDFPFGI